MVAVQEEGYQAALECNGLALLQTQIKVEPCISAGPKAKKKGAHAGQANGGHADSAPKASTCALCKLQTRQLDRLQSLWQCSCRAAAWQQRGSRRSCIAL